MRTKLQWFLMLFMAFMVQITFAQQRPVTGKVVDLNGLPLPGVNVQIKGTTGGTQTDLDGKFSLNATPSETLVFTFLGLKTQEVSAASSNLNITMEDDAQTLDSVVITALGIKRNPKELSYSTQVVRSDELNQAKAVNAATALVGKVSGLQINTIGSGVNPQTRIVLRGARSISGNNQALIVIDGVPSDQNVLSELNPNDIESTTILKGANAAALYGSAGSNGAIMVTTKKGKNGKMRVELSSTVTFEKVQFIPERQTRFGQGWAGELDPVENTNWGAPLDGSLVQVGQALPDGSIREYTYSAREDNVKDFFNVGTTKQNGISLSQGDENSTIFFSAQDVKTEGIIPGDVYHKNTFRLNASKTSGNWTLGGNVSYFTDKTDVAGSLEGSDSEGDDTGVSLYSQLLQTPINIPLQAYSNGDLQDYFTNYASNPYWILKNSRRRSYSDRFQGNVDLNYKVSDWMSVTYRGGVSTLSSTFKNTNNAYIFTDGSGREDLNQGVSDGLNSRRTINSDLIFNFDFKLTDDITAKFLVGNNIRDIKTKEIGIRGDNLVAEGLYNVSIRTGELQGYEYNSRLRSFGLYGSAEFGYKDYLFLTATGRNDWSSSLIKENNSFFYPSAGLSFVPTSAFDFGGDVLTFMKLAASYTKVGNSASVYANQNTFVRSTGFPYGDLTSFNLSNSLALSNLKPEFTISKEFNINMEFFKKRIAFDASYYISNSKDQIISAAASSASGATRALLNAGELETRGLELDLYVSPIQTEDFSWNFRLNYSAPKTEVKSLLPGVDELSLGNPVGTAGVYAIVGQEYPIIKGTAYERDDQGRVIIDQATGNPIQSSVLKNLGKTTPDYILGLSTNLNYKGFRLAAVFDYRTGHVFYNQIGQMLDFTGSSVQSAESGRLPFVFPNSSYQSAPGVYTQNTSIATSSGGQPFWDSVYSNIDENYVVDATAFKCREIAFSYTLSEKLLDKLPFDGVNIGLNARNVFMILPKSNRYTDPEFGATTGNGVGLGTTAEIPPTRTYGFNVTLTF